MGRKPRIPFELRKRPFTLAEARAAGLTRKCLTGRSWRRIGSELYCWIGLPEDPWPIISTWNRLLPANAVFAGRTAAWLWEVGTSVHPVEVILPPRSPVRTRTGLQVHRGIIRPDDVVSIRGVRVTSIQRTLRDLCARLPFIDALSAIDAAIQTKRTDVAALIEYAISSPRQPGGTRLRSAAAMAAPAESPVETRLRLVLLQGKLPRPEVQKDLRDGDGRFVARADLYYPAAKLVLEYDGSQHRDRLVEDNRRQNALIRAGFRLLRFTAADLERPYFVVSQVRTCLAERDV